MPSDPGQKIAVVGAGAVGSLIGGLLTLAGEDVTLIARKAHISAMNENGLLIRGAHGDTRIRVKSAEKLNFRPGLVLLAVKTQDVEEACRSIAGLAGSATIVTLQNGVRSDDIVAGILPAGRIISGVVMFNVQFLKPGEVTYAREGTIVIGEPSGEKSHTLGQVKDLLSKAVKTVTSSNIRGVHWSKLLLNNVGNGLEAMTGMPVSECMRHKAMRKTGIYTLREGFRTINKAGYHPVSLPGVPRLILRFIIFSPMPLASWLLSRSMRQLKTLSSTLQSLQRGRPTEIDYLNGEIVRLGETTGMATPFNSRILETVKEVEKTGKFFTPDELAIRFGIATR